LDYYELEVEMYGFGEGTFVTCRNVLGGKEENCDMRITADLRVGTETTASKTMRTINHFTVTLPGKCD
jgi:hypothetical protein